MVQPVSHMYSFNQLVVKNNPAKSLLWMHLPHLQYFMMQATGLWRQGINGEHIPHSLFRIVVE